MHMQLKNIAGRGNSKGKGTEAGISRSEGRDEAK